jgi:hypothetical protein
MIFFYAYSWIAAILKCTSSSNPPRTLDAVSKCICLVIILYVLYMCCASSYYSISSFQKSVSIDTLKGMVTTREQPLVMQTCMLTPSPLHSLHMTIQDEAFVRTMLHRVNTNALSFFLVVHSPRRSKEDLFNPCMQRRKTLPPPLMIDLSINSHPQGIRSS